MGNRGVHAAEDVIYGEGEYYCPDCEASRYPSLRGDEQMERGDWEHNCEECGVVLEPVPTTESKPRESTSVYAITKKDQEELCRSIGRTYDIPTVALRYFNIYGSRQALDNPYTGVCAIFSSRITNGNPPLVFEDDEQTSDFVHVSDVARESAAMEADVADAAVNVGTGKPRTIRGIAETLIDLYGADFEPEITGNFRAGDIRHCYPDTTAAEEVLGFKPEVDFEEGMRDLVSWAEEQDPR